MTERLTVLGAPGSPYTRKMLSVLRYRHIPYRLIIGNHRRDWGLPPGKVKLLPTVYFPAADGSLEPVVDSTPIIRRLEAEHLGRSVIPTDPVLRFIDELIEDYADEWLTKAMFHYRWHYAADIAKAGELLPRWTLAPKREADLVPMKTMIAERQIGRLYVVGSNAVTAPVIEAGFTRFLDIMNAHLESASFLFGARPASADFAIWGQLTQLAAFDPTPAALTLARAPGVYAWTQMLEDLSGVDPTEADWTARHALPPTLHALLAEIGRGYVPVMLANARALVTGADNVACEVDGKPWVQQPFPYQGRCLQMLRQSRAALSPPDRDAVDAMLSGTGCEQLFV